MLFLLYKKQSYAQLLALNFEINLVVITLNFIKVI